MPSSKQPAISIIVPFYNQELYLAECIDSLLNQKFTDLEILLIDDGSTDRSSSIAQHYSQLDPRVHYIRLPHLGVSNARNVGLKHSRADLLAFCDSDDWMDPDAIQFLYQKMQDYDADIVITTHRLQANLEQTISPTDTLKELLLERNFTFHLWGKLYKRSLWQGISFPVGHYYEDVAIGLDVISRAQRIYVSSKHIYHYRNNPNSIIGGIDPTLRYVDFLNYAETVVQKTSTIHPELLPYAQRYLWMAAYKAVIYTGRPRKRYRQILKDNSPAILQLGDRSLPSERSYARIAQHNPLFASLILIFRHKFKRKNHSAYRH